MDNTDKVVIGSAILVVLAVLIVLNSTLNYDTGQYLRSGECYDTDGGSNEYAKGMVSGHVYPSQENFKEIDYCLPGETNILKEYMCLRDVTITDDKSAWKSELIVCDNGCKNGACLR